MNKKYFLLISLIGFICLNSQKMLAQGINGYILDTEGDPIPFATIYVPELHKGTTANEDGAYHLSLPAGNHQLRFQYLGYRTENIEVVIGSENVSLDITLEPQQYMLPAVVVTASGEDPAYFIMRQAIGMSQYYLNQISEYTARVYLKGSGVVNSMPSLFRRQMEREGIQQERYFVIETISDIHFELPDRVRTEVISLRSSGNDNQSNPMAFVTISLYRDINGIISPLSRSAMQVYRFELAGSFIENGHHINRIKVIPGRAGADLYRGYIYIREDSWNIHSVDLTVEQSLFSMNIRQVYQEVVPDVWMPVSQNFDVEFGIMGLEVDYQYVVSVGDYDVTLNPALDHDFYLRRTRARETLESVEGFDLSRKAERPEIAKRSPEESLTARQFEIQTLKDANSLSNREMRRLNRLIRKEARASQTRPSLELFPHATTIDDSARVRGDAYWEIHRPVPLTEEERRSFSQPREGDGPEDEDGDSGLLRQVLIGSRHALTHDLTLRHNGLFGPSSFYYNTVDAIPYTKEISLSYRPPNGRFFTFDGSFGYAFARQRFLSDAALRYDYNPFRRSFVSISGGRATSDFNKEYGIPKLFNTITSLFFKQNLMKLYEKDYLQVDHRTDILNGLVFYAGLGYEKRRRLTNNNLYYISNPFNNSYTSNTPAPNNVDDQIFSDHRAFILDFGLSYTHRHYYRMRGNRKVMAHSNYPTISVRFKHGLEDVWNSNANFSFLEASLSQEFELRLIGRFQYHVAIGTFPGADEVFFADYRHFHTNPLWVKGSNAASMFLTLDYYDRSTISDFAAVHLHYDHSRLLLKRLPFLSDKLFREKLFFNALFVDGHKPYTEFGYGLEQLFLLFGIEIVSGFSGGSHQYTGLRIGIPISNVISIN